MLSGDRLDDTAARCVWADALAASLNGATPQNSQHRPPQPAIAALGANKQTVPTPNPAASAMERTKILTRVIILLLNSDLIISLRHRITTISHEATSSVIFLTHLVDEVSPYAARCAGGWARSAGVAKLDSALLQD